MQVGYGLECVHIILKGIISGLDFIQVYIEFVFLYGVVIQFFIFIYLLIFLQINTSLR